MIQIWFGDILNNSQIVSKGQISYFRLFRGSRGQIATNKSQNQLFQPSFEITNIHNNNTHKPKSSLFDEHSLKCSVYFSGDSRELLETLCFLRFAPFKKSAEGVQRQGTGRDAPKKASWHHILYVSAEIS